MARNRLKYSRAVLVATLVLAAAACGSDESATPEPTDVSSTAPGTAKPVALSATEFATVQQPVAVVERDPQEDILFIVDRIGQVQAFNRSGDDLGVVLDMTAATQASGEQGLLGLAFVRHSDESWWGFVNYTNLEGDTVIAGYPSDADGVFDTSKKRVLMTIEQPYPNHNGGGMFGAEDGSLLIATGDGGAANDPDRVALNLASPLGKLLRITPWPTDNAEYTVPSDNPFINEPDALPEIWSYGLRNPWRFTIANDNLWIADVGQRDWEEVNLVAPNGGELAGRGANFGWSAFEADQVFNKDQSAPNHTAPVFSYPHENNRCSISGGAVAGEALQPIAEWYLFSDFCSGEIYALERVSQDEFELHTLTDSLGKIVSVDATSGGVFASDIDGKVLQLKMAD
jgi:glucose/arabinose dehydrogenase